MGADVDVKFRERVFFEARFFETGREMPFGRLSKNFSIRQRAEMRFFTKSLLFFSRSRLSWTEWGSMAQKQGIRSPWHTGHRRQEPNPAALYSFLSCCLILCHIASPAQ